MPRPRAAVIVAAGLSVAVLSTMSDGVTADPLAPAAPTTPTTPTTPSTLGPGPPSTTVTTAVTVSGVTTGAAVPSATTSPPAIAVRRGGATSGSVAKPEDQQWSVRRMATTTGLCVIALAAAGFVYGRVRSTPPRHPDLVRSSD